MVDAEVSRLMNYHGAFDPADPKWNCQARLEKEIRKFISKTFGLEKVPAPSTIREHVSAALAKWREADLTSHFLPTASSNGQSQDGAIEIDSR